MQGNLRIRQLLNELCVKLGFCLPPDEQAKLENDPPQDVDAFTDAVFWAEGLDPQYEKRLRKQVRQIVSRYFEDIF